MSSPMVSHIELIIHHVSRRFNICSWFLFSKDCVLSYILISSEKFVTNTVIGEVETLLSHSIRLAEVLPNPVARNVKVLSFLLVAHWLERWCASLAAQVNSWQVPFRDSYYNGKPDHAATTQSVFVYSMFMCYLACRIHDQGLS